MMEHLKIRQALQELLHRPESDIDVASAALMIAREEYPGLSVPAYAKQLDRWGALAKANVGNSKNPHVIIERLNATIFDELGFKGNVEHYGDPRNSYLNQVMDRRLGIPLTLSMLYMALADRAGFPLVGVGLPGHFIVKHEDHQIPIYIDPFHRGALLTGDRCQALVRRTVGEEIKWEPHWLEAVSKVEMLSRLLRNLKEVYLEGFQPLRALNVMEWLLVLDPKNRVEQEAYLKLHAQIVN